MNNLIRSLILIFVFSANSYALSTNTTKTEDTSTNVPSKESASNSDNSDKNSHTEKIPKEFKWAEDVGGPLTRLAGVILILGFFLYFLDLKKILKPTQWSERTIIALSIILTFCASSLVGVNDEIFRSIKDVALVVVGFYFGSSKVSEAG